jgi:hypothetical protein
MHEYVLVQTEIREYTLKPSNVKPYAHAEIAFEVTSDEGKFLDVSESTIWCNTCDGETCSEIDLENSMVW